MSSSFDIIEPFVIPIKILAIIMWHGHMARKFERLCKSPLVIILRLSLPEPRFKNVLQQINGQADFKGLLKMEQI